MKCTNCGNHELFETQAFVPLYGYGTVNVQSFACTKCGHVEFFVPEQTIQRHYAEVEQKKAQERRKEQILADTKYLEQEIQRLESIVADENQTVKVVKEAELELNEIRKKLAFVKRGKLLSEYNSSFLIC